MNCMAQENILDESEVCVPTPCNKWVLLSRPGFNVVLCVSYAACYIQYVKPPKGTIVLSKNKKIRKDQETVFC